MEVIFRKFAVLLILISILFQSCGISDLRPKMLKKEGITNSNSEKGKQLLEDAWKKAKL